MTDNPSQGADAGSEEAGTAVRASPVALPGSDALDEHRPEPDEGGRRRVVRRPPEQTTDDTDAGWGERTEETAHDRWLRDQRPPHWE